MAGSGVQVIVSTITPLRCDENTVLHLRAMAQDCSRSTALRLFSDKLFYNFNALFRTKGGCLIDFIRYFRLQADQFRFFADRIKAKYQWTEFHTGGASAAQVCIYYYFSQLSFKSAC